MSPLLSASLQHATQGLALDVSLSIEPGTTALFGPSGAGKSTLLRILAGLVRPQRGHVSLQDRVLLDTGSGTMRRIFVPPGKRGIGYQTQSAILFPHLSVEENIRFGLQGGKAARHGKSAEDVADEVIRIMGLDDLRKRKSHTLSGGEKQRAVLARTLAPRPALLLLDEPFSALDNENKTVLWAALAQYRKENGICVLLVSHDAAEVWQHTDRVIRMHNGKTTGEGTPAQMLAKEREHLLSQLGGIDCAR